MAVQGPNSRSGTGYTAGGNKILPSNAELLVLEVLLKQANEGQCAPLDITVQAMMASTTVEVVYQTVFERDIGVCGRELRTHEVRDDEGTSSRRHVLIEVKAGVKRILSVLDLCADKSSKIWE